MKRERMLLELFRALWLSADFESDLEIEFPSQFTQMKWNEEKIPTDDIKKMYEFMDKHPVFNWGDLVPFNPQDF